MSSEQRTETKHSKCKQKSRSLLQLPKYLIKFFFNTNNFEILFLKENIFMFHHQKQIMKNLKIILVKFLSNNFKIYLLNFFRSPCWFDLWTCICGYFDRSWRGDCLHEKKKYALIFF